MDDQAPRAARPQKKRKISLVEAYAIGEWLRTNWPRIERDQPTRRAVCGEILKALELPNFSPAQLDRILEAERLEWPGAAAAQAADRTAIDALEITVAELVDRVARLTRRLISLEESRSLYRNKIGSLDDIVIENAETIRGLETASDSHARRLMENTAAIEELKAQAGDPRGEAFERDLTA